MYLISQMAQLIFGGLNINNKQYCNNHVLSLTHMFILNVCLTKSMHGLYTSTQHLDKTLEPLNWIRVRPSRCEEHSCKLSHVLYYVACNFRKYPTFKQHTRPSFYIHIPSNGSHLNSVLPLLLCTLMMGMARKKDQQMSMIRRKGEQMSVMMKDN